MPPAPLVTKRLRRPSRKKLEGADFSDDDSDSDPDRPLRMGPKPSPKPSPKPRQPARRRRRRSTQIQHPADPSTAPSAKVSRKVASAPLEPVAPPTSSTSPARDVRHPKSSAPQSQFAASIPSGEPNATDRLQSTLELPGLHLWSPPGAKQLPNALDDTDMDKTVALLLSDATELYVGQDLPGFPDCLVGLMQSNAELSAWQEQLDLPGTKRRVMLLRPDGCLLAAARCPTIADLKGFLDLANIGKLPEGALRVFAGRFTELHGLPDEARDRIGKVCGPRALDARKVRDMSREGFKGANEHLTKPPVRKRQRSVAAGPSLATVPANHQVVRHTRTRGPGTIVRCPSEATARMCETTENGEADVTNASDPVDLPKKQFKDIGMSFSDDKSGQAVAAQEENGQTNQKLLLQYGSDIGTLESFEQEMTASKGHGAKNKSRPTLRSDVAARYRRAGIAKRPSGHCHKPIGPAARAAQDLNVEDTYAPPKDVSELKVASKKSRRHRMSPMHVPAGEALSSSVREPNSPLEASLVHASRMPSQQAEARGRRTRKGQKRRRSAAVPNEPGCNDTRKRERQIRYRQGIVHEAQWDVQIICDDEFAASDETEYLEPVSGLIWPPRSPAVSLGHRDGSSPLGNAELPSGEIRYFSGNRRRSRAFVLNEGSSSEASLQGLLDRVLEKGDDPAIGEQLVLSRTDEESVADKRDRATEADSKYFHDHEEIIDGDGEIQNALALSLAPCRTEQIHGKDAAPVSISGAGVTNGHIVNNLSARQNLVVRSSESKHHPSSRREKTPAINNSSTPKGTPTGPSSGKPFSGYVYLWNYREQSRSERLILIEDALSQCDEEKNECLSIYDGQDYDFENGLLSSWTSVFDADKARWASRDADYCDGASRKVRLWSESLQVLRFHRYSPLQKNLPGWLVRNLDFAVFLPAYLNPSCTPQKQRGVVRSIRSASAHPSRNFYRFIRSSILPLIRQKLVVEVEDEELVDMDMWNWKKECRENRGPFESRASLSRFLISHPWIEIHGEQEELSEFWRRSGFKLIPIMLNCPARVACFWDREKKEKLVQPRQDTRFTQHTILECLSSRQSLDLYLGQDTEYAKPILNHISRRSRQGYFPYSYMLAYTGEGVRKAFSESGWIAAHLEVAKCSTAAAVFWNRRERKIIMQPDMASFISIEEYLQGNPDIELYVGQDTNEMVQSEIKTWFEVLTYKPGYSDLSQKPVMTMQSFLPVSIPVEDASYARGGPSKAALEEAIPVVTTGGNSAHGALACRESSHQQERLENAKVLQGHIQKRVDDGCESVPSPKLEMSHIREGRSSFDAKARSLKNEPHVLSAPSQDTTNCSHENLDETSVDPSSSGPASSRSQEPALYEDSSDSEFPGDDVLYVSGNDASSNVFGALAPLEERLRKARETSCKVANLIREAGPKILNRQLLKDLRQSLREDLILEVTSVQNLISLSERFRKTDFIAAADDLCELLEDLDFYKCFTDVSDFGYGPPDFSSLRSSLESGVIYTMSGLIQEFRYISEDLLQFHQNGALRNEAVLIRSQGEKLISEFISRNLSLYEEEKKLCRIGQLCGEAKSVGFRVTEKGNRARRAPALKSPSKAKPAIRVSGYQSEVTFLNYRDEKGNSVMGKRHSARVFGISIDRRKCEAQVGNVQLCHVCLRKVFRSDGDSLRCSNSRIGLCEEVVCGKCLESVFGYGKAVFIELRHADNWVCVHCAGLCGNSSHCKGSKNSLLDVCPPRKVLFEWPHAGTGATTVAVHVARRSLAGQFESWDSAVRLDLSRCDEKAVWSGTRRLRLGFYRCKVAVDNEWHASTTFLVSRERREHPYQVSTGYGTSQLGRSVFASLPSKSHVSKLRRRRIRWKVSNSGDSRPVHTFSEKEGGETVKDCSRTEGYDWRRSKRHAIVQWIPQPAEESVSAAVDDEAIMVLRPSASAEVAPNSSVPPDFPKLKVGMSYTSFQHAVTVHRFDYMVDKTSWGIVAGKSDIHGIGLFTLTGYRKGDFVIEYAGELIRSPLADVREARYDAEGLGTYFFKIDELQIVDATVKSNRARFTNHSCNPNMSARIIHVRGRDLVVLLATRDIPRFSELTFHYQLPLEDMKLQCLCNSWNCEGVMN